MTDDNLSLRPFSFIRDFLNNGRNTVLISMGKTKVLCAATLLPGQPKWMSKSGQKGRGWITAEYSMLPYSTIPRTLRAANRSQISGRIQEIQRMIGRSSRQAVSLDSLGENTIYLDCDVLAADGGTRTAAINGCCVALYDCLNRAKEDGVIRGELDYKFFGAVSLGLDKGKIIVDLNYQQDSSIGVDLNLVINEDSQVIEIQASAEQSTLSQEELNQMTEIGSKAILEIIKEQRALFSS